MTLALCGVASTLSSCEAALWSGKQSTLYNESTAFRTEAAQEATAAGQLAQTDLAMFVVWTQAYASHDDALAEFYVRRFRDEFKPAFEEWVKQRPLLNPDAAQTPFALPSYRIERRELANDLSRRAEATAAEGEHANSESDRYVRGTVIFALALFFAGVVQTFDRFRVKLAMLIAALAMLVFGICLLFVFIRGGP
jgi:hypothetical protein